MTYYINKTDGNLLTELPDGQFDTVNSSLTLVGKNVTNFGEIFNENLVKLLENFSSSSSPEHPIKGQLWYDASTGRLNVYDGTSFRASGGPLVSSIRPNNLVPGDLWINNETNQLWFYDGTDLVLAGPVYTAQQKKTGFEVVNITDNNNRLKVITKLWANGDLLGIYSNTAFTPALAIEQFTGNIGVGFTSSSLAGNSINATVSRADSLVTALGAIKTADDILFTNQDGTIYGSLTVQSVDGIRLLGGDPGTNAGAQGDTFLKLDGGNFIIENNESSRAIEIKTKQPVGGSKTAIYIDSVNQRVGFFNRAPTSSVDINGDLKVSGNLIIEGDSFTINTTTLQVEDKNIELNKTSGSSSDLSADGGGITLKGTTDKTLSYSNSYTSWDSSENFNLVTGRVFEINHVPVLSSTTLGSGVVNSSLKTFGNITTLNLTTGLNITNNTITGKNGNLVLTSDTANISVNGKRIINVPDLNFITSPPSDAANKRYVDERVSVRPLSLATDISEFDISTQLGREAATNKILEILTATASIYDSINNPEGIAILGTIAKVATTHVSIVLDPISYKPIQIDGPAPGPTETVAFSKTQATYVGDGFSNTVTVVEDIIEEQIIPAPQANIVTVRGYKRFKVNEQPDNTLAWEFITDYAYLGAWISTNSYSINDVVIFDNKEWICIAAAVPNRPNPPSNATNWLLFRNI
jgi:hypothetical protein